MKRGSSEIRDFPARHRDSWKLVLLGGAVALGTWLLLSVLVPLRLPEDFPRRPDLLTQNAALQKLVDDADSEARRHPNTAEAIGRLGMVYSSNQYYEQAESAYRIAMGLGRGDYRWPYCRALAKEETGQEMEAHDLLRETLRLKSDYIPALQKLADIYYKQDKLDDARHYYELSLNAAGQGSSLQALFGLGRVAARRGQWAKIIEYVGPLSREYPNIRPAHQMLLDAYEALGQADLAEGERRSLLEPTLIVIPLVRDPLGEELLHLSCSSTRLLKEAGLLSRFRRPDDAIQVARRAASVEPGDPDVHHFLARTLLEAHGADPEAVDEALTHLEEGLRLRPDDLLPLWHFASIYFKQKKTDGAVSRLQTLLAGNAHSSEAHYYLGLVADRQDRTEEAITHYHDALQYDPGNAEAYHRLGLILVREEKFDEAIVHFQRAVYLKPMFTMARCNLGVALERKGKISQAIAQFDEALRIKPNDATTHMYLAIALMRSGKVEGAVRHFRETIRFAPDDAEAYYGLGCALALQRKAKEASEVLREALRLRPDYAEAAYELQKLERKSP